MWLVMAGWLAGFTAWSVGRALHLAHRDSCRRFVDFDSLKGLLANRDFYQSLAGEALLSLLLSFFFVFLLAGRAAVRSSAAWLGVLAVLIAGLSPVGRWTCGRQKKSEVSGAERRRRRRFQLLPVLLLAFGILECTAFNSLASRTDERIAVDFQNVTVVKGGYFDAEEQNIHLTGNNVSIRVDQGLKDSKNPNIAIGFGGGAATAYLNINVEKNGAFQLDSGYSGPTNDRDLTIYRLNSGSFDAVRIDLSFTDHPSDLVIEELSFCAPLPLVVSPVRLGALAALSALLVFLPEILRSLRSGGADEDSYRRARRKVLAVTGTALVGALLFVLVRRNNYLVDYPFSDEQLYDQSVYQQLFDAIRKGQFHLDIKPSDDLLALANPYDPYARGSIDFLWDRALFNGRYYCYYGILPVFIVMFPLYFLTGQVATNYTIMLFGSIAMISGFVLMMLELARRFAPNASRGLRNSLILVTLIATGLLVVMGTGDDFYHIPYIYGLGFAFWFVYFTFVARRRPERRGLLLGLAGLCFVFVVCSRPNLALIVVFTAPLFLKMLFEKKRGLKKKAGDFAPMGAILLAGAAWICYYNYARFENIFEFGQFYQLTVVDSTELSIKSSSFYPAFYHFFLQSPSTDASCLIGFDIVRLPVENHPYNAGMIGLLQNPFFWPMLAIPFALKRRDSWDLHLFCYLILPVLFILALATYCYAGICPRYVADIYPFAGVLSCLVLLKLSSEYGRSRTFNAFYLPTVFALSAVGLVFGFAVMFNGFDGIRGDVYLGFFNLFPKAINLFNS